MRMLTLFLAGGVAANAIVAASVEALLAIRNGAEGRYTYRVVDDEGGVVTNARANDPNIEGDQTLLYAIRNYRK